jgi:hypothetical protein
MSILVEMEYPHWMMVAGALLVVAGFIGLGFSWYMNRAPAEDNLHPAAPPNSSVAGMAKEGEDMSAREPSAGLWVSWYMNRAPAENNLHPAAPPNSSVAGMAEEGEEMSARESSAGVWELGDDDQLREMAASGKGPFEIARLLRRSPSAVRRRASLLGITVQDW